MKNPIEKTVKDVRDAAKEGWHRGQATAEHESRTEFGDVMTGEEKAGSMVREVEENAKAGVDRAKRNIRDMT